MVLNPPLVTELRNDFFHLVTIPIWVFLGTNRLINNTFIADALPLFRNARLYIRYNDVSYDERSSKILLVVLMPIGLIGTLFCLSLLVAFNLREVTGTAKLTLADGLIWFIGVTAQQGSLVRPNSMSTMMLILVALLFSSIMYCTYLSRITSELSVDVEALDYLEDLLETNEYRIGFVGNGTIYSTPNLRNLNIPLEKVILQTEADKTLYANSYEEGIRRMLQSKYALIGSSGVMRKALSNRPNNESCQITELRLDQIMVNLAFEMKSMYAYRKMINYA
ncbi:AGAP013473-PA-like protein [Anopheles sinensis]|uniref:AGAP013473-PA-like protein n=1 Tax=Anopheles sinensis TaxID=74873 RepID=A0A084W6J2_ANOSI|nr:AGAP013473-PA-like protein [Anopheles sinensis]